MKWPWNAVLMIFLFLGLIGWGLCVCFYYEGKREVERVKRLDGTINLMRGEVMLWRQGFDRYKVLVESAKSVIMARTALLTDVENYHDIVVIDANRWASIKKKLAQSIYDVEILLKADGAEKVLSGSPTGRHYSGIVIDDLVDNEKNP